MEKKTNERPKEFRVLGRMLAEELREEELKKVSGGKWTQSMPSGDIDNVP